MLFEDFNLCVNKGEAVGILGASGCGKSTLFELITCNAKPINGSIESQKIAQIYQDPYSSFHPSYSIIEQIKDVVHVDKNELLSLCAKLDLHVELLEQKTNSLSGGQLQRCSILRALLQKPDLILADEPTSALDNVTALSVAKLLIKFLDRVGILLVTHDVSFANWISDRIIKLDIKK